MNDNTFIYRAFFGILFFTFLGYNDYRKNPNNPKKLKEYLFLFSVTIITMLYGIFHDYITYSISKNYFIIAKGLTGLENGFSFNVIKLALIATWTAGLITGVTFLFANNENSKHRQLTYKNLYKILLLPLSFSIFFSIFFGSFFYINYSILAKITNEDLSSLGGDLPSFMFVWGIHIGSYVGAIIGLIISYFKIIKLREKK